MWGRSGGQDATCGSQSAAEKFGSASVGHRHAHTGEPAIHANGMRSNLSASDRSECQPGQNVVTRRNCKVVEAMELLLVSHFALLFSPLCVACASGNSAHGCASRRRNHTVRVQPPSKMHASNLESLAPGFEPETCPHCVFCAFCARGAPCCGLVLAQWRYNTVFLQMAPCRTVNFQRAAVDSHHCVPDPWFLGCCGSRGPPHHSVR